MQHRETMHIISTAFVVLITAANGLKSEWGPILKPEISGPFSDQEESYFRCSLTRQPHDDASYHVTYLIDGMDMGLPVFTLHHPKSEADLLSLVVAEYNGRNLSCTVSPITKESLVVSGHEAISNEISIQMVYGQCSSNESLSLKTFDLQSYNSLNEGIFRMMGSSVNEVLVDVKQHTGQCGTANCAVAMGSGGTDTVIVDRCSGPMQIYRCQANYGQNIVLPTRNAEFTLTSLSGTAQVVFDDRNYFANVVVSVQEGYNGTNPTGLCSNFDGDPTNDFEGLSVVAFIESNRIAEADSLFSCPGRVDMSTYCHTSGQQVITYDGHTFTSPDEGLYKLHADRLMNRYIEVNRTSTGNCAVGVRSGTDISSHGHRGEIILIDKCDGEVKVRKCQTQQRYPVIDHRDGTFEIISVDSYLRVRIKDRGTHFDVEGDYFWAQPPTYTMNGLCGNHDGDPNNEYTSLPEFMEANRVEPVDSFLVCDEFLLADAIHIAQPGTGPCAQN